MKINHNFFTACILMLLLLISTKGFGQVQVGIRGGISMTNVSLIHDDGTKQATEMIPRFQIGVTLAIPLKADFYLQPAVLYAGKGYKEAGGWIVTTEDDFKAKLDYIEVPLNLRYKSKFGAGNLLIAAGPYIGYGIGGKWKSKGKLSYSHYFLLEENSGDILFVEDLTLAESPFGKYIFGKPWDYGLNVGVGYEFLQKFSAQFNLQYGLTDLTPTTNEIKGDYSTRNKGYNITVGYHF